ncbi:uncharacterized protein LOC123561362 isoform X2 [Mercenaria mercenaria]|uniref:uncharacterized protein LOC123561362 isoform X2 n=1 Tax=Mercenaria mercenaria TaxID=6596 RepID=UPI00234F00FF|nr:uncharacterized protein LOC123561362 isoform X2 [Mercenaria mercenaria]
MFKSSELLIFASLVSFTFSATTTAPEAVNTTPSKTDDGGLQGGDIAAILLGCFLLAFIVFTVVLCILYQKGYIGNREDQVLPFFPDIYTTPESLRQYTDAAMENFSKGKKSPYVEKEPIIYINDDIYHPPKSRPLPTDRSTPEKYPELVLPAKMPRKHRANRKSSRRRRHSEICRCYRQMTSPPSQMTSPTSPSIASYPDNAVFIPEKGGMKFTMFYETRSPYADRKFMSKTF